MNMQIQEPCVKKTTFYHYSHRSQSSILEFPNLLQLVHFQHKMNFSSFFNNLSSSLINFGVVIVVQYTSNLSSFLEFQQCVLFRSESNRWNFDDIFLKQRALEFCPNICLIASKQSCLNLALVMCPV